MEDRIKEILKKDFSEINEEVWKELRELIAVQSEVGEEKDPPDKKSGEGEGKGGAE